MPTKRISADEAHNARKDLLHKGADGKERLIKIAASPPSWDSATRSARFVMTSQTTDRYGDVVVTAGLDTTEFEKNPIALLMHRSSTWPIGNWANLKRVRSQPPRLEGDLVLHKQGGPIPEIDQAAWMIEQGGLRAASIGFLPDMNEVEMILNDAGEWTGGLQFNKSELLECSLVGIPANPDALAKSIEQDIGFAREVVEYALDNWARDPDGLSVERASFEAMYSLIAKDATPAEMIETQLASMDVALATSLCEKFLSARGKFVISRERADAIERAARNKRLQERRDRDLQVIRARGEQQTRTI